MRIRELESFVAVAEELHFARAAARLHLAQQPLSQNVKKLEERLSVALFERTTRSVRLSPAGEAYLPHVRSALRLLRDGREAAQQAARGESGLLLGYVQSALTPIQSRVPALLRAFRQTAPHCTPELRQGCSAELLTMLAGHELDAVFYLAGTTEHGSRPLPPGVQSRDLERVPLALAVPPRHPLAAADAVTWRDLATQPLIGYASRQKSDLQDQFTDLCRRAGFVPDIVQEADSEGLMLGLVAAGIGVAVVPQTCAGQADVVCVPLREPEISLTYALAWLTGRENIPLETLLNLCESIF